MTVFRFITLATLVGGLSACSKTDKKDPLLEEAARYHNEATQVQAVLEPKIDQIDSLKIVLTKQYTPGNAARTATLDSVKRAFEEWESNLIEVPGMPHTHSHEHGSHQHHRNAGPHHTDATLKDLPAEQMRDLQRETLNNIRQLQARFDAVAPN